MRYTPDGVPVTNFPLAIDMGREKPWWLKVTCWRKLGEAVNEHLDKGSKVLVEGELDMVEWEGNDKNMRTTPELTARTVEFLGGLDKDSSSKGSDVEKEEKSSKKDDFPW